MYKTAAMPAEQSRASTGKKVLVPLSRYEQALFRRDMSQHWVQRRRRCALTQRLSYGWLHSPQRAECDRAVGMVVRCRVRRAALPQRRGEEMSQDTT